MNVGPNSQGSIDTIFQERLRYKNINIHKLSAFTINFISTRIRYKQIRSNPTKSIIVNKKLFPIKIINIYNYISIFSDIVPLIVQPSSYISIQWRQLSIWIFNFDQAFKQHGNKEKLAINSFSLFTCKLVIWKKLAGNQILNGIDIKRQPL